MIIKNLGWAINRHRQAALWLAGLLTLAGCADTPASGAAKAEPQNVGMAAPRLYQEPVPMASEPEMNETLPIYDKLNQQNP